MSEQLLNYFQTEDGKENPSLENFLNFFTSKPIDTYNMNTLIESFLINSERMNDFLIKNEGIIAGGGPLAVFNKNNDYHGDLDIFIYSSLNERKISKEFDRIINLKIYKPTKSYEKYIGSKSFSKSYINSIDEYICGQKKIQLIFLKCKSTKVLENFDFSFCATWWDGKELNTLYPELTKLKKGFIMKPTYRTNERIKKYKNYQIFANENECYECEQFGISFYNIDNDFINNFFFTSSKIGIEFLINFFQKEKFKCLYDNTDINIYNIQNSSNDKIISCKSSILSTNLFHYEPLNFYEVENIIKNAGFNFIYK